MDAQQFDAFARAIGPTGGSSRRRLIAAVAGALALVSGWGVDEGAAKRKKRKKREKRKPDNTPEPPAPRCVAPTVECGNDCCATDETCITGQCLGACRFTVDDDFKTMTLQTDCATTETIVIPDGFTLEGNARTIHLAGPLSGYQAASPGGLDFRAGLLIKNGAGSVKNLKIDQDALECIAGLRQSAIVLENGKGAIEAVQIRVTRNDRNCFRGGINAQTAADLDAITVRNVTITGNRFSAIAIDGPASTGGPVQGDIRDCTITGPSFGMLLTRTGNSGSSSFSYLVEDNTVTAGIGISVGSFPAKVFIDGNTITGLSGQTNLFGVNFAADTVGTVSNSTISGFTCGVAIQPDAGTVTESNNTFSANTTNVCDPPT